MSFPSLDRGPRRLLLAHRHSGIGVRIDTVGQPSRIADCIGGKASLLHSCPNRLTIEQRSIESTRKCSSPAIAHNPERTDEEANIETDQLIGPTPDLGQG